MKKKNILKAIIENYEMYLEVQKDFECKEKDLDPTSYKIDLNPSNPNPA